VRGLPEQLAQVFVNLVTNACHAMAPPADGRPDEPRRSAILRVSTVRGGDDPADAARVTIVVADTGCGIAKDNLPLIFTPFFTTKAAGKGTGLGLSIVKKIVDGHGGDIRAESDTERGTRFILTFPVEDSSGGSPSP
jgi:signal transduction histidine kinase